jgi:cellulose synthase/poly-beta-1,6-N-acetylglucosamine synthase-like glycosyltransferase
VSATGAYSFLELEAIGTLLARLADILTQTFYNIPVNDPLTQTMSHFASMTEVVNDALGHANCLGSGYVMRRVALESIGGFPTESLAEDICCSATLLGEGWKTAFVPEVVQYGSAPESYLGHIKQRTRWVSLHSNICWLFQKVYVVCTNLI